MTTQRHSKDKPVKKRKKESVLVPIILFILLYVGSVVAGVSSTQLEQYNYQVGDICEHTITAPYDFVDEYSTNLIRQEEMQKVQPVYMRDNKVKTEVLNQIDETFVKLESTRISAKQIYLSMQDDVYTTYSPNSINWEVVLTNRDLVTIKRSLPDYISDQDIYVVASLSQDKLSALKTALITITSEKLEIGIVSDNVDNVIYEIADEMNDVIGSNSALSDIINKILANSVSANLIYDTDATEAAKQNAADAVSAIEYKTGENIVRQGERITQKQYEIINQLGLTADNKTMASRWVVGLLLMGIVFGVFVMYLYIADKTVLFSPKKSFSMVLLSGVTIGIALGTKLISAWILPVFLPVIVATAFLKRRTSLAYSVFMSLVVAFVLSEGETFFFSDLNSIRLTAGITGSVFAVLTLQKKLHRGEYILSGLYAGLLNGVINLSYVLINSYPAKTGFFIIGIGVANGLVCGLLSVGVLPIWENLFSLDTPSKLLEIASPGNELMKNLMVYAPGTYHHCIMVANLAETAAEAVGGNALLARVASYYHDIGKLQNPNMFSENQMNISNPHDELTPEKSAEIIIAHTKQGKILAEKNKLPKAVRDIIVQHHGDSLVGYFYIRAKQSGEAVDQRKFRYPGPKPQTKEAGIVMLADTVEAAVRANNTLKNGGNVEEQIEKLIKAKYDDGQLDECPLNRRDLVKVREAFLTVFSRANHERIVYPEDDE